ncbi:hypothetical protein ACJIZ3_020119 [Penstemon smallii]|uniref:F-box domain-containing protein n=1 Tax=Penstemon smallii TaxID=265156 RepID=A0ABD3SHP8_9LAMI
MEASREVASKYSTKIENLPECILIHILSFLTTLEAVRTTMVCRAWRNLWYQVPSFSFDIIPFHSPSNPYTITLKKFIQCVNRVISIRPFTHVQKFHLRIDCNNDRLISNVNNWVLHAINSKVIELDLDFDTWDLNFILTEENCRIYREVDEFKEFPFNFFHLKDSSVKVLKLRRSSIICPPYVGSSDFQSVQSLFFDDLNFEDREVNDVIKFCVNLEYLTIHYCIIPECLEIYSSKLKKCELESLDASEVVISAPRLHSVSILEVRAKVCFLEQSPNLVVAKVGYDGITLENYSYWCHFMSSLATTKYLTVPNMYLGQEEFLKEMEITEEFMSRPVILHIPRLRKVKMMNYRGIKGEIYVVELIKRHQSVLEEVVAFPPETAPFPLWMTTSNSSW